MKTPEEIKRDMAKCAKRAKQVIMYSCDVEEMAEYTETVSNTLIVGRSLIQQLQQENAQKEERIRKLEREKEALSNIVKRTYFACLYCKYNSNGCTRRAEEISPIGDCFEWRGVEEE